MKRVVLLALLVAGCSRPAPPEERYGFVAQLGNDTISVERVVRQGNTITSDEVDRFPIVRRRHTVITLNDSGAIQRLAMDIRSPNDSAPRRERHIVAEVAHDSVHLTKSGGGTSTKWEFAANGGVPTAHVDQMYSLYELRFQEARRRAAAKGKTAGDTVMQRQFYIDREFDRFPMNHGMIRILAGNKAEIAHDWLAGTGEATFDSTGHMLTYSGAKTTYLVEARRVPDVPDLEALGDRYAAAEARAGVRGLSVRDTTRATIGAATLSVDYGRPLARGRTLVGGIIPYDIVWRTGANAATQLFTSRPITLAGLQLPAGGYTLWTVPHANGVELIVNKQTGQWGTSYDRSRDLGRAPLKTETLTTPVEQFTISITGADATHGTLAMEWGPFRWTAPIVVK